MNSIKIFFSLIFLSFLFVGCDWFDSSEPDPTTIGGEGELVEFDPTKDASIQEFNLNLRKRLTAVRFPCDTIALIEHILKNYPPGTYLVESDRNPFTGVPNAAVLYEKEKDGAKIYALVAKSKEGERLIEVQNVVGYYESWINYDSTKLGTAFFYLTYFTCKNDEFTEAWDIVVPSHGGFNVMKWDNWKEKNVPFIAVKFFEAVLMGHFDYNYYFVNGKDSVPHLMLTYETLQHKRTAVNANDDKYIDFVNYVYLVTDDIIQEIDSITFIWKDTAYISTRNPRHYRPY